MDHDTAPRRITGKSKGSYDDVDLVFDKNPTPGSLTTLMLVGTALTAVPILCCFCFDARNEVRQVLPLSEIQKIVFLDPEIMEVAEDDDEEGADMRKRKKLMKRAQKMGVNSAPSGLGVSQARLSGIEAGFPPASGTSIPGMPADNSSYEPPESGPDTRDSLSRDLSPLALRDFTTPLLSGYNLNQLPPASALSQLLDKSNAPFSQTALAVGLRGIRKRDGERISSAAPFFTLKDEQELKVGFVFLCCVYRAGSCTFLHDYYIPPRRKKFSQQSIFSQPPRH